ncbi:MAG: hypothetical protein WBK62_05280 [Candidatus Fermentibacter daniensis]|nr:MAG: hypothetical protein AO394_06600 [Candidatus Fermentibacter daniensis]KZD19585.1 MAG: hypothetical protein AO396_08870 [Candidatus Fermentibacter daniensis]MBP7719211.1 hypothetical protein [Candidatus Fermentibacter sp.]
MEESIPVLRSEASARRWDSWAAWRLARAYNLMEMPDSAVIYAREAWSGEPQRELFLAEYFRALCRAGRPDEVLALADLVRHGGTARYYAAACGHAQSRAYLEDSVHSADDSTSADACCWLSVLTRSEGEGERSLALLRRAVELAPDDGFYRAMLVEELCDAGLLEEAREHLLHLRRNRWFEPQYWSAGAALARLEGDWERCLWALRRSVEARTVPGTLRSLGWGLVSAARADMREGRLELAAQRLAEACGLDGGSGEEFAMVADSLAAMISAYE